MSLSARSGFLRMAARRAAKTFAVFGVTLFLSRATALNAEPGAATEVQLPASPSVLQGVRGRSGLLYVPINIGDRKYWMMVDTGSNRTLVDLQVCQQIGQPLAVAKTAVRGATGSVASSIFELPPVSFGSCVIRHFRVAGLNWSMLRAVDDMPAGQHSIGLLGTDVLSALRVTIDLETNTLRLPPLDELKP